MEELLASQSTKFVSLFRGQEVEGEIVAINDNDVILDLGAKSEGVIQKKELSDENLKIGNKVKAYVLVTENENGQAVLSIYSSQSKTSNTKGRGIHWAKFVEAQKQKINLKGRVTEVNKGGLIVEVDFARGFLPNSQVGYELLNKLGEKAPDLMGQTLTITVIETDQSNNKLIFSQKGQVSEEIKNALKKFEKGSKLKGRVEAVLPFGLVVGVDGTKGLVFISDIAWEKVDDIANLYKTGDEVEVAVLGADEELGRLNLSIKQLKADPFTQIAEDYPADEVVKGDVTGVSEAGVTVALDGVEGLLPASKMDPDTSYEVGKSMSFLVDSVDMQRRRINLAPFVTSTAGLIYK